MGAGVWWYAHGCVSFRGDSSTPADGNSAGVTFVGVTWGSDTQGQQGDDRCEQQNDQMKGVEHGVPPLKAHQGASR